MNDAAGAAAVDPLGSDTVDADATKPRPVDELQDASIAPAEAVDGFAQRVLPSSELEVQASRAEIDEPRERERLGLEHELIVRRAGAASRVPSEAPAPAVAEALRGLQSPAHADSPAATPGQLALLSALRAELDQRARSEAALRMRLVDSETRMAARELLRGRTATTLLALRDELDGLRDAIPREREARRAAELRAVELERDLDSLRQRTQTAYEAITELRGVVQSLRATAPGPPDVVEPGPAVTPDAAIPPDAEPAARLSEALVRLRDGIAPLDARVQDSPAARDPAVVVEQQAVQRTWLRSAIVALAKTDPEQAGRLIVDLVPAQGAVDPAPVAYDLVLGGEFGCVRVTVDGAGARVVHEGGPRASGEVDFQVFGDYAALARLLTAGWLRRRWGRGVARVRGNRRRLAGLDAVVDARLGLPALYDAGVRLHPRTALALLAQLLEPGGTDGQRFALAYGSPPEKIAYLVVADGALARVTEAAPEGGIATTIAGPAGTLERVLSGADPEQRLVTGERWPLPYVRRAIKRAQSG